MSRVPTPKKIGAFDSALEFSWNHILETLGLSPYHHPLTLFLPLHNQYYEPDFMIEQPIPEAPETPMDHILEAKASYDGNRIHKPHSAAESYTYPITLLLPPFIPSDPAYNSLEVPWADWRPIKHQYIFLRPNCGFIPPSLAQKGDYVPGTLYATFSPPFKEFFQPLDHPHYSLIDS